MVLTRLRQETAPIHKQVEERLELTSSALTTTRYTRVLQAFCAFFSAWESSLDADCPAELSPLWQGQQRAYKLRADLERLGGAPDPALNAAVPRPHLSDRGRWLGALYVLEGSRLGGQIIARHVEKHFGWSDGHGYSFFSGAPDKTAAQWRSVCNALESSSGISNQILKGAHQTFDHMNRCLALAL